ncbi:hypothetical protein FRC12_013310 [Ceratobasidium sp. 428]|nr:hypothetical protein FRC12_013310 [Ceratobasidium sp. 428]
MQTSPWAMPNTVPYPSLLFVGLLILAHYALRRLRFRTTMPFPPGPPSRPVIGQLLSMPQQSEHLVFTEIGKQVGSDIISLSFFGTTVIVLNSAEAATEILDKRANIYSNREVPPMLASPLLMNLQDFFVFMNPTERWRRYRRLIHSRLNKQSIAAFHAPQEHQAKLLLQRLLDSSPYLTNSDKLDDEFNRTIASTAFDLVYGYPLETAQDPFLTDTKILMDNIMKAAMPSNFLVNAFPWLAYVPTWAPGAQWKKTALEWRDQKDELTDSIYNWTKERANAGADECSLIASALKDCQQAGYDWTTTDEFSKRLGIAMYGGK